MSTSTLDALTEALDTLGNDADRLAAQAVTGVPALDPSIAYLTSRPEPIPAEIAEEHAAMTAAASAIEDVREEALDLIDEARTEVRDYRVALLEGAKDRSKAPTKTPDLDPYRAQLDTLHVAYGEAVKALVRATVDLNAKAESVRWLALDSARRSFVAQSFAYDKAVSDFVSAYESMKAAESQALALDPVLSYRLDAIHRYVQDVAYVEKMRRDSDFAVTRLRAAAYSQQAVTLLCSDGWLRGEPRIVFERMAPEPLPVDESPVPVDDADDVVSGYVPDESEWTDGEWSDGFVPAQKPKARRKVASAGEETTT